MQKSLTLLATAASVIAGAHGIVVNTGESQLCSYDYEILQPTQGDHSDHMPIEIVSQNGDSVEFKVYNVFTPMPAGEIYTEYHINEYGAFECVMDQDLPYGNAGEGTLTAHCDVTQPITVVNLYVRDPTFTSEVGTGPVPACCHPTGESDASEGTLHMSFLLRCSPTCEPDTPTGFAPPVTPYCGDGSVDADLGEACDEGEANCDDPGCTCSTSCEIPPPPPTQTEAATTTAGTCPEVVLNFDDLPAGGFIYDEWWESKGVKIVTVHAHSSGYTPQPKSGCTSSDLNCYCNYNPSSPMSCSSWQSDVASGGAARVFNTNQPKGYSSSSYEYKMGYSNPMCNPNSGGQGDNKYGSPNQSCGGPGNGSGGAFGAPGENCPYLEPINNILVIQEGKKTCPDDVQKTNGGSISFVFNPAVTGNVEVTFARFMSLTDSNTPTLYFYDDENSSTLISQAETEIVGKNGLYDKTFDTNPTGVGMVKISYPGIYANIAELRFVPSICPSTPVCGNGVVEAGEECDDGNSINGDGCDTNCQEECPEVVLDFNDLPPGGFIYDERYASEGYKVIANSDANYEYTPRPKPGCTTSGLECYCDWDGTTCDIDTWVPDETSGAARVFDTSKSSAPHGQTLCGSGEDKKGRHNKNTGDDDLGSPAAVCDNIGKPTGPGDQSASDVLGFYANCPDEPIGNVLIIQEDTGTCPDDAVGGTIAFEFDTSMHGGVYFTFAQFLDIDDGNSNPYIDFRKVGAGSYDTSLRRYTDRTEGNGLLDLYFHVPPSDIEKIKIFYPGSGCIAQIRFRPTQCPARRRNKKTNLRK